MHGKPGAVLIIAKREHAGDMIPDFSGPSFLTAKKKMLGHGQGHESPCAMAEDVKDEEEGIGEALTTDGGDESYDTKVAEMRKLAQKMMVISDELGQASEMHAEQSEEMRRMADKAGGHDTSDEEDEADEEE